MFEVLLAKKPRKFFEQSDDKTRKKLLELFSVLEVNPWPAKEFDVTKLEDMNDCYRIRIGKQRVCYHVNTDLKEITVYRIEKRSETTYK